MIKYLLRNGVRKGLLGGSRTWLIVGAFAGSVRVLQRMAHKEPEVLLCEELPVGTTLVISNPGPAT